MFSNRTIIEIVNSLYFSTHDQIERFSLHFELNGAIDGNSISTKETSLVKYLKNNSSIRGPEGSNLLIEIIEYILATRSSHRRDQSLDKLKISLSKEGYELTEISVRKSLPEEIPILQSENRLVEILKKHNFVISLGHYNNAIAAHGRGEWASSNAQLRSFVEGFFNQIHESLQAGNGLASHERKMDLAKFGFFIPQYNEFINDGKGFVEGFWKRLHPEGSHPGLSEQSDSTFRLHLVLLVVHYFAERFDKKEF